MRFILSSVFLLIAIGSVPDVSGQEAAFSQSGGSELSRTQSVSERPEGITARSTWRVTDRKPRPYGSGGSITGMSSRMGFMDIDIFSGGDSISFGSKSCKGVRFEASIVDAKSYLTARYAVDTAFLGIADAELTVVRTNCNLPGMSEFIRLNDRRLVVLIDDVFYFLEPNTIY